MSYSKRYAEALQAFLELKEQKAARKAEVEEQVRANMATVTMGASLEHVIHGRLNTDPLLKEIQVQMDRAAAEATMYGIGAIIRNLAFLAKERGGS